MKNFLVYHGFLIIKLPLGFIINILLYSLPLIRTNTEQTDTDPGLKRVKNIKIAKCLLKKTLSMLRNLHSMDKHLCVQTVCMHCDFTQ